MVDGNGLRSFGVSCFRAALSKPGCVEISVFLSEHGVVLR